MTERKMFNKKWLVALSILVLVAITVTMVVVFLPKKTDKAIEKIYNNESTMFLQSENEKTLYNSFVDKLDVVPSYRGEANFAKTISETMHDVVLFYKDSLLYAESDGTFQDNYGKIVNGIDRANDSKNRMNKMLGEIEEKIEAGSISNLRTAWRDYRREFVVYLNEYSTAIEGMSAVYQNSLPKGVRQNQFTYDVLDSVNYFLDYIIEDYQYMVNVDVRDNATTSTFAGGVKIEKFENFVEKYLNNKTIISSVEYSSSLQSDMTKIKSFKELYKANLGDVIKSIKADYGFAGISQDTQGLLDTVKTFLNGGCRA